MQRGRSPPLHQPFPFSVLGAAQLSSCFCALHVPRAGERSVERGRVGGEAERRRGVGWQGREVGTFWAC